MICVTATLLVGWSDCPGNGQSDQLSGDGTRCVVVLLFCHEKSFVLVVLQGDPLELT